MDNNKKFCIISLLCKCGLPVVSYFFTNWFANGDILGTSASSLFLMIPCCAGASIAAWVLAIIARYRYKSAFSLALIIIYIVLFVIAFAVNIFVVLYYLGSNF